MTPDKKTDAAARPHAVDSPSGAGTRKPWTPKSPIDVVLDQIAKQEKRVAELQHVLDTEKTTLNKLLQAKRVLEST